MAVDWLKIKNDYINGGGSYRKLAEKYGVNKDTIAQRAKSEKWKEQRAVQTDKTQTKTIQKTEEKISDALSDEAAAKAEIRAGLVKLAADWVKKQEEIGDTNDFRRMVQSCVELGIMSGEADKEALAKLDDVLKQIGGVV